MGLITADKLARENAGDGGDSVLVDHGGWLARKLAEEAKVEARQYLAPHHKAFLDALVEGVKGRKRTAMNLYPKVAGMLDAGQDFASAFAEFFKSLRVRDELELRHAVERGRAVGESNLETSADRAKDLLRERMRIEPGYRRALLWELFGIREASMSEAVVVETAPTNGHTNGHNGHA